MTAPGNGLGGIVGVGSPVLNPDGSANIGASVGAASSATPNIWNLPKDVPTGQKIWFDTEYSRQALSEPTSSTAAAENGTPNPITKYGPYGGSKQLLSDPTEIFQSFAKMSVQNPAEFTALQQALNAWGTVSESGVWGPQTESALKSAMSSYWQLSHGAKVPISFKDYILQAGAAEAAKRQQPGQAAIPRVMDPAQIRNAAQNAAQQALGRGLDEKQLEQFVTQFQQEQLSNQDDPYTTSYKLPGEAMQFAQNVDPSAYRQNQAQSFANVLVNMFAPSVSQRPNMQPTPSV
jgi:hypothetical protein